MVCARSACLCRPWVPPKIRVDRGVSFCSRRMGRASATFCASTDPAPSSRLPRTRAPFQPVAWQVLSVGSFLNVCSSAGDRLRSAVCARTQTARTACRNVIDALAQCAHSVIAAADAGTDASLAAAGPGSSTTGAVFRFSFRHSHACTWLRFIWHRLHNSAWKGRHACSSATSSNHGPDRRSTKPRSKPATSNIRDHASQDAPRGLNYEASRHRHFWLGD